uniref:DNA-directed RNA polymerase RpoA/D/Rpb3-type domain-containing protein n=1 Tax=viral metagenome TaxID=1070528 RepID=A0A6C0KJF4_9ZZZZ
MDPIISDINEENGYLRFTLENVNTSIANALRRIIISEIPTVVIRTFPYDKNDVSIEINNTTLNNEIIKQRLGCIPIHIKDLSIHLEDYLLELNKTNTSSEIEYLTTEDIKIKNVKIDKYISETELQKIFPKNIITNDFILINRLKPKISNDIKGEQMKLTAKMSVGTAKEDGRYNVASTISYAFSIDSAKQNSAWLKYKSGLNTEIDIEKEKQNWYLHDGKRFVKSNSFDFIIETIGVYTNMELIKKACDIMIQKFNYINNLIDKQELPIKETVNTLNNCYDITLKNEDYTLGKVLEYLLHEQYYANNNILTYVGFKKFHPHDDESIIRISFKNSVKDISVINEYIKNINIMGIKIYEKISNLF